VIAAAAILALGLGAALTARGGTDPRMKVNINGAQALDAARGLAGAKDGVATGPFDAIDHRYFRVEGEAYQANVDAFDGSVRTLLIPARYPAGLTKAVDGRKAQATATSYLAAHGISTKGLKQRFEVIDHGSVIEYQVTWDLRINGARVPDSRTVSVNPETGEVFAYTDFHREYAPPPSPNIDETGAVALARAFVEAPDARVGSTDLLVWFDPSGNQLLVWWIGLAEVDSNGGAAMVQVDAVSGDASVIARG
jgi:hypothetical protein